MEFLGKSNAFEISKRLGLKDEILENAKSLMSKDDLNFEDLIKEVHLEKSFIESEKKKILNNSNEIIKLKQDLENQKRFLDSKESKLIDKAKLEAREILLNAKDMANKIIKQMNDSNNYNNLKDINNMRNSINHKLNDLGTSNIIYGDETIIIPIAREKVIPNAHVFVSNFNKEAIVLTNISKSDEVQVQIGTLKTTININQLEESKIPINNQIEKKQSSSQSFSKTLSAKTELNVIGTTSYEAIESVDKFLDDACLAGIHTVRIVHGKGSRYSKELYCRIFK